MIDRLKPMLIKEFIQIFRNPRMKGVIFAMPIIQLFVFSYAVTTDVKNIATAAYDLDNSKESRELISRFVKSGYFEIVEYINEEKRARDLMDRSSIQAIIRINKGFGSELQTGKTARIQIIMDGTDSNTATIALSYSTKIAEQFSQETLRARLTRLSGATSKPGGIELETRAWFNENLDSRNFFVPGVMALIVTLVTLLLTSMAVVREKEIGTMEQILVTPITPVEFILGKTLPFALIAIVDVLIILLIGTLWFGVPMRGNPFLLLFATVLYLMTTLGVGLLISTLSETQQQAMMSTFFFFMPGIMLSGFIFPVANMPEIVQWLAHLNPMLYFLVIIRGIFLKGVGASVLWPNMMILAVMGFITLWLASRRFKKTIT